jgi:hypothetical protein
VSNERRILVISVSVKTLLVRDVTRNTDPRWNLPNSPYKDILNTLPS